MGRPESDFDQHDAYQDTLEAEAEDNRLIRVSCCHCGRFFMRAFWSGKSFCRRVNCVARGEK